MKRRGNNEGTIYQLPDGRWIAMLSLGWRNGKRWRKAVFGTSREEADRKLTKAKRDRDQSLPLDIDERQTLEQFLRHWLTNWASAAVRPRTFESYQSMINLHITPELGHVRLTKLGPQQIQTFLNRKVSEKDENRRLRFSPRTVQIMHATLRRALGHAEKWGLVWRNVAKLVDSPRGHRYEIRPYDADEARAFVQAIKGHRFEALFCVAMLGLREGEQLGLKWEDSVDLDAEVLHVRQALQRINGKLERVDLKTDKSRREVPLPRFALAALRRHRARQLEERLAMGADWKETGFVFTTTIGTPLDARNIHRIFVKLLTDTKLRRIRYHDLRHTAASLLHTEGVSIKDIQEILGHSLLSTTADVYTHLFAKARRDAVTKIDEVLGRVRGA